VAAGNNQRAALLLRPNRTALRPLLGQRRAGVVTSNHEDMHGGEAETSILLAISPEVVRPNYHDADFTTDERRHLLTLGIHAYSASGVIGRPSLATPGKGKRLLEAFSTQFKDHLALLRS
jgi:creatinine amidohydrolase